MAKETGTGRSLAIVEGETMKKDDVRGDLTSALKDVGNQALDNIVSRIEIKTTAGNITLVRPFETGTARGGDSVAGKILRPKVTVYNHEKQVVFESAPYGEPKNRSGVVKLAGLGIAFGILAGMFGAGRASKR